MEWRKDRGFVKAVKGTNITSVDWIDANGRPHFSIFYQDPGLFLKEHLYDFSVKRWVSGESVFAIPPAIDDIHQIVLGSSLFHHLLLFSPADFTPKPTKECVYWTLSVWVRCCANIVTFSLKVTSLETCNLHRSI